MSSDPVSSDPVSSDPVSSDPVSSDSVSSDSKSSGDVHLGGLLEQARAGDRESLRELVRVLNPVLWRVARAQGLSTEDAADVVQTSWLELIRRLDEIRNPRAVTAWLITATRRESWQRRARTRRDADDPSPFLEAAVSDGPAPEERLLTDERDRVLWRHFALLSERCRDLLRIVAQVDRPDYTVIASAFGMPHGSIGPTRGRCLSKLREMLLADPAWSA
jgi:RNA polymerase sigma factor (sigma-70 family)